MGRGRSSVITRGGSTRGEKLLLVGETEGAAASREEGGGGLETGTMT
jgi:hypothetical protein